GSTSGAAWERPAARSAPRSSGAATRPRTRPGPSGLRALLIRRPVGDEDPEQGSRDRQARDEGRRPRRNGGQGGEGVPAREVETAEQDQVAQSREKARDPAGPEAGTDPDAAPKPSGGFHSAGVGSET